MLVGRLRPVARISFWKPVTFATLTVTELEVVAFPAASRALAASEWPPFAKLLVSHA